MSFNPEAIYYSTQAWSKNDPAVSIPREKYNAIIQTKQNIANRLYSEAINTIAPKCI